MSVTIRQLSHEISWPEYGETYPLLLMVESTENNFELSFVNGPPWSPNRMPMCVCVSVRFKLYPDKWVSRKLHERHATGSYPTCAALSATGINKTHTAVAQTSEVEATLETPSVRLTFKNYLTFVTSDFQLEKRKIDMVVLRVLRLEVWRQRRIKLTHFLQTEHINTATNSVRKSI
jgi:hypothetical protein